ncbi:hypothetical protein P3S68_024199 [Capsicum galapagoense]
MSCAYEKMLKDAEWRLEKIYETVVAGGNLDKQVSGKKSSKVKEKVNEGMIGILQEAAGKSVERVDLSGRQLRMLPKAFGKIRSLIMLNLSKNQLKICQSGWKSLCFCCVR